MYRTLQSYYLWIQMSFGRCIFTAKHKKTHFHFKALFRERLHLHGEKPAVVVRLGIRITIATIRIVVHHCSCGRCRHFRRLHCCRPCCRRRFVHAEKMKGEIPAGVQNISRHLCGGLWAAAAFAATAFQPPSLGRE